MRTFCLAASIMNGSIITSPPVTASDPEVVYSIVATWIKDHDYILPYRKDTLPFILEKGGKWTHLYFPDTFYEKGYRLGSRPDELHIMRFNNLEQMQNIFSSPEYTEPANKYFDKAFAKTLAFPATGEDPVNGKNGNFENYFVTGFLNLNSAIDTETFTAAFHKVSGEKGLVASANLLPMLLPGSDVPHLIFIASFNSKLAYQAFMDKEGENFFEAHTNRYALIGGYDSKKVTPDIENRVFEDNNKDKTNEKTTASSRPPLWRP